MEPLIRYVRSADGTRIATWTLGSGPPIIAIPGIGFGTMQISWEFPGYRAELERLARHHTVVGYDQRGFGLSDHDAEDFSTAALADDLEAVAQSLGDSPIDVIGRTFGAIPAIAYAARSERVRHLVLVYAAAHGEAFRLNAKRRILARLMLEDFDLYAQAMALVDFGWTEVGRRAAELIRTGIEPETLARSWNARRAWDVRDQLSRVRCPTLVLYYDAPEDFVHVSASRDLAAAIPDARFSILKGLPLIEEEQGRFVAGEVLKFLGTAPTSGDDAESAAAPRIGGTATILFADVVGSTELTERLGDEGFRTLARRLDDRLRALIRAAGGRVVEGKLLGDGVLGVFPATRQAIHAAFDCARSGEALGLPLHLGIHAGDVIEEDGNVFGGAVNIAARLAGLSAPGEVLVSDTVRALARTSARAAFQDCGEHVLKGVADAVRVFAALPVE